MRFTLRRDPYGRLLACADDPSGRDVDCRVHVCVRPVPAGQTSEARLVLAVPRCAMPTDATGQRRVRGSYSFDSLSGFIFKPGHQLTPAVGQDAPVQAGLCPTPVRQVRTSSRRIGSGFGTPDHLRNSEVFDPDDVERPGEFGAGLLDPVRAPVSGSRVQSGDRCLHPLSAAGPMPAARQAALQSLEPHLFGHRQPGTRQKLTSGQSSRHCDATVHADDPRGARCRDDLRHNRERKVPATGPVAGDTVRSRVGQSAGQPEPNPSHFRYQHPRPFPAQLLDPGCLCSDNAESFVLPCLAPGRLPVSSCVEVPDGLVEVPQGLLLHGLRSCSQPVESCSRLGELPSLLHVAGARLTVSTPHRPLLERQVPYISRMPALHQQRSPLLERRVQAEPGHGIYPIRRDRQSPITEGRQSWHLLIQHSGDIPRRNQ